MSGARVFCHACGQDVPPGKIMRGFLINEKATIGAKLVELERNLRGLPLHLLNLRRANELATAACRARLAEVEAMLAEPPSPAGKEEL